MPGPGSIHQSSIYMRHDDRRSPSEIYKLNGDCGNERKLLEDAAILSLFKENESVHHPGPHQPGHSQHHSDASGSSSKMSGSSSSSSQPSSSSWMDMASQPQPGPSGVNGQSQPQSSHLYNHYLQHTSHYSSNPYLGGPNVTPPYSHLTGGLLEDKSQNNDSSSSSESESSHGSSHQGRYESHFNGRSSSAGIRMNKDEKLAREAGIKLNIKQDIVDPPMDEFNDMLSKEDLTEEQLNICRDIRRRGKNKVAAQNCRKRKLEQIDELQKKVDEAKKRQNQLKIDHEKLLDTYTSKVSSYTRLTDAILAYHHKSPQFYAVLVQGEDVRIIDKNEVPVDQRFPKSPESLRYRPPPAPAPLPDVAYNNGNNSMMFCQNNHHPSYIDRAWD